MWKIANIYSLLSGHGIKGLIWKVIATIRALGPYPLIELVLPAGSLILILLWLYWRSKGLHGSAPGARSPQMVSRFEPLCRTPLNCCVTDNSLSRLRA
jgi:hypothetical protein